MTNALIIDSSDNVIVAIEPLKAGDTVTWKAGNELFSIVAAQDITIYHKLAACDIPAGAPIIKYGEHIGIAARDIKQGEHVHTHNVADRREDLDERG